MNAQQDSSGRPGQQDALFLVTVTDSIGYTRDTFGWYDLPAGLQDMVLTAPDAAVWAWTGDDGGVWHVAPRDANS